ncbi:hypothetical protein [Morganella morganii]|uniref:hypothetical protein n=1 Tax=Morganella morganii TaxID=582 RepID=UPI002115B000|nr:hypothetical protein [Morganella morganii]
MRLFISALSRYFRFIVLSLSILLLTACKTELYSGLQQKEANEMYSLLLENHIIAEKKIRQRGKGNVIC